MIIVEKKPVPVYEVECYECKSRIRYKKSEVVNCQIKCPVCGVYMFAYTYSPVDMVDEVEEDDGDN